MYSVRVVGLCATCCSLRVWVFLRGDRCRPQKGLLDIGPWSETCVIMCICIMYIYICIWMYIHHTWRFPKISISSGYPSCQSSWMKNPLGFFNGIFGSAGTRISWWILWSQLKLEDCDVFSLESCFVLFESHNYLQWTRSLHFYWSL